MPDLGGVGVRLLPAQDRSSLSPAGRGRAAARPDRRAARGQLLRLWITANVEGAAKGWRGCRSRPGRGVDAHEWDLRRQARRQALAHHAARSGGAPAPGSGRPRLAAAGPNELWVAELTYLRCWEGVVFFAFIIDAFSRRIVGWQLAGHMRTTLVLDALKMALHQRGGGADVELVHHSDRGSQPGLNRSSQRLSLR